MLRMVVCYYLGEVEYGVGIRKDGYAVVMYKPHQDERMVKCVTTLDVALKYARSQLMCYYGERPLDIFKDVAMFYYSNVPYVLTIMEDGSAEMTSAYSDISLKFDAYGAGFDFMAYRARRENANV